MNGNYSHDTDGNDNKRRVGNVIENNGDRYHGYGHNRERYYVNDNTEMVISVQHLKHFA